MLIGVQNLAKKVTGVAQSQFVPGQGVLVFAGEVLIGGGVAVQAESTVTVFDRCWGVTDLAAPHWVDLLGREHISLFVVAPEVCGGVRMALERSYVVAVEAGKQQEWRRQGAIEALTSLVKHAK